MADVIEMIQLSPTMEEGKLVAWNKAEGDEVEAGDIIAEVETDKAAMDMESFYDGVILKILVQGGEAVPVGTPMAIVGEADEDISGLLAELAGGGSASTEAPAEAPAAAPTADAPAAATAPTAAPAAPARADGRILSSPLARKLAEDKGIDLSTVTGSGPAGRIVKRDVEAAAARPAAAAPAASAPVAAAAPAPITPAVGAGHSESLSPMRKAIAKNLSAAWQAPAFMLTRTVRMDAAMALRKQINAQLEAAGTGRKVSVNDLVIKAAAKALIDVPAMNSAYQGDSIYLYDHADIGIAVALDGGLITPVIRNAESKPLSDIAVEARELAGRARDKKLAPDEYTGSTFSISNLGMFGIDHFTAVLNPPAAGILAVGRIAKNPVVGADGGFEVASEMTVTLTCDHRAVDGAVGATWLQAFATYLENPMLLIV